MCKRCMWMCVYIRIGVACECVCVCVGGCMWTCVCICVGGTCEHVCVYMCRRCMRMGVQIQLEVGSWLECLLTLSNEPCRHRAEKSWASKGRGGLLPLTAGAESHQTHRNRNGGGVSWSRWREWLINGNQVSFWGWRRCLRMRQSVCFRSVYLYLLYRFVHI